MWYRVARVILVLCMAVFLTAGIGWADEINNSSRIQNLEVDLLKEAETRMGADSAEVADRLQGDTNLQQQIDTIELTPGPIGPIGPQGIPGPQGESGAAVPTYGFISVPLMPTYIKYGNIKMAESYDPDPQYPHHHNVNGAPADTSILWQGWMSADFDPAAKTKYYVPIQLPHGATITSLSIVAYDNDPTYDGRVNLRTWGPRTGGASYRINSNLYTNDNANVPRTFTADSIKPSLALVDNWRYSYSLEAKLSGSTDVVLISAIVGYELETGQINYSGIWDITEITYESNCDDNDQMSYTMALSHVGNDITFGGPEDTVTGQLNGNTVIIEVINEADELHATVDFTSINTFTAEATSSYWDDQFGYCFLNTSLTGSR